MTARTTYTMAAVDQPVVTTNHVTLVSGIGTANATTTTALTGADANQDNNNAMFVREINRLGVEVTNILAALHARGVTVAT
jgi:hypothetical protein